MNTSHTSTAFSVIVLLATHLFCAAGCSRLPETSYTLRLDHEKVDLPAKHKTQIAEILASYHGTPSNPRMAVPSESNPLEKTDKVGYDRRHLQLGQQVYTQQCAGCHGTTGDGQGPAAAYLNPPPRDYRNGVFKFTSTPRGAKPRREDLHRILKYAAKGTSMPNFRFLSEEDTEAVIDYVQVLSARGELEINLIREATDELLETDDFDPQTVAEYVADIAQSWDRAESEGVTPLTVNPAMTADTVHDGAKAFAELSCVKCHNRDAAGSRSADVGVDIWGRTAYPANLAMGMLHGGRRPIDIYRRIYSGINGTPMPSSKDPNSTIGETPTERSDRIWHLVHFVTKVIENNGVAATEQAAIDEVLKQAETPAPPAEEAPESKAASVGSPDGARLARGRLPEAIRLTASHPLDIHGTR
jgi:mono/diheme cytochrome c family protein